MYVVGCYTSIQQTEFSGTKHYGQMHPAQELTFGPENPARFQDASMRSCRNGARTLIRANWRRWAGRPFKAVVKWASVQSTVGCYSENLDRRDDLEEGAGTKTCEMDWERRVWVESARHARRTAVLGEWAGVRTY